MAERHMHNDWKAALRDAVERKDVPALARIPKTDLHCHGLLSAPLDTYTALLGRPLPPPPAVFGDFRAFADYIVTNLLPALAGPEPVRTLIRAAFERLVSDGVVYAEMSFDLLVPEFVGLRAAEFADILREECAQVADRLTVAPEIGIARGLPPDEVRPRLKDWLATGAFGSIDLYDDESLGVLRDFAPLYQLAGDHGLKLKAHAGSSTTV